MLPSIDTPLTFEKKRLKNGVLPSVFLRGESEYEGKKRQMKTSKGDRKMDRSKELVCDNTAMGSDPEETECLLSDDTEAFPSLKNKLRFPW